MEKWLEELGIFQDLPPIAFNIVLLALFFLITFITVWILQTVVSRILLKPLHTLAEKTANVTDDEMISRLRSPIRLFVVAIAISLVTRLFTLNETAQPLVDSLVRTLTILALILFIYRIVDFITISPQVLFRFTGIRLQERLLPFLAVAIKVFIIVMGLLIVIQDWGYEVNGLIASLGVVGLAFSLAAQDTAANVFGFAAIVGDHPFKVGDLIKTADIMGTVEHVGVRSTRLRQLDQAYVTIPNSKLSDAILMNLSRIYKRRLDFTIGLTYETNSQQIRAVIDAIRTMLEERELVETDSIFVRFVEFGASSLDIRIICFILLSDWDEFMGELEEINLAIMDIVADHHLEMAFPSRSLYIESMPANDETNHAEFND